MDLDISTADAYASCLCTALRHTCTLRKGVFLAASPSPQLAGLLVGLLAWSWLLLVTVCLLVLSSLHPLFKRR
jgi:hypothetical protein